MTDVDPAARALTLTAQLEASLAREAASAAREATLHARERATRLALLRLHAYMRIAVGVLTLITGTVAAAEILLGVWVRPVLGCMALIGGVALAVGIDWRHRRHLRLEALGLVLIGLWDLSMVTAIAASLLLYPIGHLLVSAPWHHSALDPGAPRPYLIALYLGLAAMVWCVHLPAVLRERRIGDAR